MVHFSGLREWGGPLFRSTFPVYEEWGGPLFLFRQVYEEQLCRTWPTNPKNAGNIIESIVGLSYGIASGRAWAGGTIEVVPPCATWIWESIWWICQERHLGPALEFGDPSLRAEYSWNRCSRNVRLLRDGQEYADLQPDKDGHCRIWGRNPLPPVPPFGEQDDDSDGDGGGGGADGFHAEGDGGGGAGASHTQASLVVFGRAAVSDATDPEDCPEPFFGRRRDCTSSILPFSTK